MFEGTSLANLWKNLSKNLDSINILILSLIFHLSLNSHEDSVIRKTQMTLVILNKFFYSKGGQFILFLLKLYNAIILPKLLYAAIIWINGPLNPYVKL